MAALGTPELTVQERGVLATSASPAYLDCFSGKDRVVLSTFQQPILTSRQRKYYSRGQMYRIEWQDYGQPLPAWFDKVMQGFVDLRTLPRNWDSYGASPIDQKIIQSALDLINVLLGPTSPAPRVVPMSSGGLQLEWHPDSIDLEVVFDRDEQPFFYYRNRVSGDESEHGLPQDNALLSSIIRDLE